MPAAPSKEHPRVLHLLNSRHFNGAENMAGTIMSGLEDRWESLMVSRSGPIEGAMRSRGLSFQSVEGLRPSALRSVAERFKPDLIHAHDYRASLAAVSLGVPIVSHLHNNYPWAKRLGPVTLAYRFALPRFRRILAVSPSVLEEHIFRKAMRPKTDVVSNGLDFRSIRQKAVPKGPPTDLVFVGRLTEQKDPLAFVRIVEGLQEPFHSVTGIMLGAGDLLEPCREAVSERGLGDRLQVAGYVGNPYPAMAGSKICIVPSRWEGFGLAALEAMSLGVVALGRPVGGLADVLSSISPELLCDTEEEFVHRSRSLLSDEDKRVALAAQGIEAVEGRFSLCRFLDQIEDVYAKALATSNPSNRL